jgi:hypothetical protein
VVTNFGGESLSLLVDDNVGIKFCHDCVVVEDTKLPAMTETKPEGVMAEEVFIYDSPQKITQTAQLLLSSSSDDVNVTQSLKNQTLESINDVSFHWLMTIADAWEDKSMIKSWETANNVTYTCMKAQLQCNDSALVTDFDKKYEDLHVNVSTCSSMRPG